MNTARSRVLDATPERFAPWSIRRAMRRHLDAALDGLASAVEGRD